MKTITISDDVYEKLKALKKPGESFSDVLRRILEGRERPLTEFYGVLRGSTALRELMDSHLATRQMARERS